MPARRSLLIALAGLAVLALHALPSGARAAAAACTGQHWVASWMASPTDAATGDFEDQTLRAIVTPHLSGTRARLHLSNRFGTGAVTFNRVTVARRSTGAALVPHTDVPVTFAGAPSITVPAGQEAVSDPVLLSFNAFDDLAVSMYFATATGPVTEHFIGRQTSYATPESGSGDHTGDESGDAFSKLSSTAHYFVTGIDVMAPAAVGAVVAFGDSLTDGYEGSPSPLSPNLEGLDVNGAYPDALQRRLLLTPGAPALVVLNAGISGNRILAEGLIPQHGPSALGRLRSDALDPAGVTDVIVQLGFNDIGNRSATADQIIAGLAEIVAQIKASGRRALLGTLSPSAGAQPSTYGDATAEAMRQQINAWIRTAHVADAVVDFDAALRDPSNPSRLLPAYDSSDHLHPNLEGYRAMADAVNLATLKGTGCPATSRTPPACRSTVTVHVPSRYRAGLRRAVVRVDGRRVGTITKPGGGVRVSLRGRAGHAKVTVTMRIERSGRRAVGDVRRFARCPAS